MAGYKRFLVLFLGVAVINVVTWLVLSANLREEIYAPNADSIGLPLMGTFMASVLALPMAAAIAFVPPTQWYCALCLRRSRIGVVLNTSLLLAYCGILTYGLAGVASWALPHHYLIAVAYLTVLIAASGFLVVDVRRLRTIVAQR